MKHLFTLILTLLLTVACHAQEQRPFSGIDYPFEVQYADLDNGQTVAYHERGSANEALILIHGLGSYLPAWKMNIDALSDSYRVIALDLPGYGKSTKSAGDYSIPFFAESVTMLMDELDIDQAAIVGHSMGGQVALYLAANFPERASQLILSAPAGFEQFTDQDQMAFQATISPTGIATTPDEMIRENIAATFYNLPPDAQFMVEDRISMRTEPGFDDYAEAQAQSVFAMLETPVLEMMPETEQPTLVIFGSQDALIPNRYLHPGLSVEDVARKGTERLPNATLKLIDSAGHFVHFEKADEFNEAVLEFLNQN
ncbi:alpha/beta fold hydrolase [Rhodohalobacter sp. 8-1]|uniref:alpha/beta fold hydrolase n=1 Tax=Rhodohalobacter sp. 8-1 TaxID=3131972 RepID=UPI0030ECBE0B